LAPFFGIVRRLAEPQSCYRKHTGNFHAKMSLEQKLSRQVAFYEACVSKLEACFGVVDSGVWRRHSWWHRQAQAVVEIAALPKANRPIIVVDEGAWEVGPIAGRTRRPFLEKDGEFYGSPPDDETAIRELERMRQQEAGFIVFAWPAFWWLQHYCVFHGYLRSKYPCVLENERLVVFEL